MRPISGSASPDGDLIRAHVVRVDVQADHLVIELRAPKREPPPASENGTQSGRPSDQLEADRIVLPVRSIAYQDPVRLRARQRGLEVQPRQRRARA